ncbi:Speedy protein E4A, partial [Camelus dromedarius]
QKLHIVACFLYPAPWASSCPLPPCPGWKRKWSVAFQEEVEDKTAAEAEDTWVVESLCGLKMKLKRHQVSVVLPEHHEIFKRMLEDPVIKRFLAWDKNLKVSDKYLLSMVIAYFSRAGLFSWQYQRIHFFIALYLANDMEEDNQAPKQSIFPFLYGKNRAQRPSFHRLRFQFIRSMGWKTRVTREECEKVGGLWGLGGPRDEKGDYHGAQGRWRIFKRQSIQTLMTALSKEERSLLQGFGGLRGWTLADTQLAQTAQSQLLGTSGLGKRRGEILGDEQAGEAAFGPELRKPEASQRVPAG